MNIDLTKYKRLFTFGCSFTNYRFPTWAHILSKSMPGCEFHNLGRGSGGNLFIANRLTEANKKFKFCETDLVVIMWSTLCREDRFVNGQWMLAGNIFTQNYYDDKFVKTFCDPVGYLIRDLSLIELAKTYLESLPCDSYMMLSVPFTNQIFEETETITEVLDTYSDLIDSFPTSMFDLEMNETWTNDVIYRMSDGQVQVDYHPTPTNYYNYLTKLGFVLNDDSETYARESDQVYRSATSNEQLQVLFHDEYDFFTTKNMW